MGRFYVELERHGHGLHNNGCGRCDLFNLIIAPLAALDQLLNIVLLTAPSLRSAIQLL
jgi:hypothetical protein